VICAPVFGEILAGPGLESGRVEQLLAGAGIDWEIEEGVFKLAGRMVTRALGRSRAAFPQLQLCAPGK